MRVLTDEEFVALWHEHSGSPARIAKAAGLNERTIYRRRDAIRGRGIPLETISTNPGYVRWTYDPAIRLNLRGASVLVGSDLHVWPGPVPAIWHAFCAVAEETKPDVVVLNGDLVDGARISRHPRLRNQNAPSIKDEADALTGAWLPMLRGSFRRLTTIGNHDQRLDSYLQNNAPEMADWCGGLYDRMPDWSAAYAVTVNDHTEIRHLFRGGIHAAHNNTMHSGISIATGHTHQLGVKAFVDRRGRRYGVETGMLNDPMARQFEYTIGLPTRWTAGFVLLTFDEDGELMPPELCEWVGGRPIFRGRSLDVPGAKPRIRVKALSA